MGVITGVDGNYELKIIAGSNNILVFSFLGMQKQEEKIPENGGVINITMKSADSILEEVVVTGYGNVHKPVIGDSATAKARIPEETKIGRKSGFIQ